MDLGEPLGLLVVARSVVQITMARTFDASSDLHREMFARSGVLFGASSRYPHSKQERSMEPESHTQGQALYKQWLVVDHKLLPC